MIKILSLARSHTQPSAPSRGAPSSVPIPHKEQMEALLGTVNSCL